MILKTFDEIVTVICDSFDSYMTPYKIRRDNTNVLYLIFKAVAKGFEVINNVAVKITYKFDPKNCDDYDLESTAKIVGTKKILGSGSGLVITVKNNTLTNLTLAAGDYVYAQTSTIMFYFSLASSRIIAAGEEVEYAAFTELLGAYHVTAIASLVVTREDNGVIPTGLFFSCADNELLLGYADETPIEFRKRILSDTSRQDTLNELELAIRNLPYIFECKLLINQLDAPVVIDGITVQPYQLLLILNGSPTDEIARMIAAKVMFPTTIVDPLKVLYFYSDCFVGGKYAVHYTTFLYHDYDVALNFLYDQTLISEDELQERISEGLKTLKTANTFTKYITENKISNMVNELSIPSMQLLDVSMSVGGTPISYVTVPDTRIPRLVDITYSGTSI